MKVRMAKMVFVLAFFIFLGVSYARGAETWITLNKPGAEATHLYGKSGNNIVGTYNIGRLYGSCQAFLYDGTSWTDLNAPGPGPEPNEPTWTNTQPQGIDGNNVVGWYHDASWNCYSFLYDGKDWTTLDAPEGATGTRATGIDGNNVVGWYNDVSGNAHGFFYDILGKSWTTLDKPGESNTLILGASGNNVIGHYESSSDDIVHSFFYDGKDWTTLDIPGVRSVTPEGISGNNVVGVYYDLLDNKRHGFLYDSNTKSWTTLDKPGATSTEPFDIDGNEVVGTYKSSPEQGFIYNIPEPSTLALLVAGSIMFAAYLWRRRQQMQR